MPDIRLRRSGLGPKKIASGVFLLVGFFLSAVNSIAEEGAVPGLQPGMEPEALQVGVGDVVFIVNTQRTRALLRVQSVSEQGLTGITLESELTSVTPGYIRYVPFNETALLQVFVDVSHNIEQRELALSRPYSRRSSRSPRSESTAVFAVVGALVLGAFALDSLGEAWEEGFSEALGNMLSFPSN